MEVTLSVTKGPEQGSIFDFESPDTFLVGRAKDCHLRLSSQDPYVSRHHFLLEICPPLCVLKDLNSSNPPRVNGKIVSEVELHDKDVIEVGYTQLTVGVTQDIEKVACRKCGAAIPIVSGDTPPDLCDLCKGAERKPPSPGSGRPPVPNICCMKCGLDLGGRANSDGRAHEFLGEVDYLCERCLPSPLDGAPAVKSYVVIKNLGKGGMGRVDLVYHKQTGRLLAMKKILKISHEALVNRFEREVRFTRELVHENLIRYIDSGVDGREPYLVMQYVSEGHLGDLLLDRGRPFEAREAIEYMGGVLSGIEIMHRSKIVHRDIKPENILVKKNPSGRYIPKISDFGLAKKYSESGGTLLTQRGVALGTLFYMPPEQIRDTRSVRETADLYSIGVTLYYLLTGCFPYNFPTNLELKIHQERLQKGKSLAEVLMSIVEAEKLNPMHIILTQDPVPIRNRNSGVSEKLARVVDRSIRKDSRKRYQTATEFRKDLVGAI